MLGTGRADLGDQRHRSPPEIAAEPGRAPDDVVPVGPVPPEVLEKRAAHLARELVAGVGHGDLGEGGKPRGSQHLLAVDRHAGESVAFGPEPEDEPDPLAAGDHRRHRGDRVGDARRRVMGACGGERGQLDEVEFLRARDVEAASRQHDRDRLVGLGSGQRRDAAQALAGE